MLSPVAFSAYLPRDFKPTAYGREFLGQDVKLTTLYDNCGCFFEGNGGSSRAYFTAPSNGNYAIYYQYFGKAYANAIALGDILHYSGGVEQFHKVVVERFHKVGGSPKMGSYKNTVLSIPYFRYGPYEQGHTLLGNISMLAGDIVVFRGAYYPRNAFEATTSHAYALGKSGGIYKTWVAGYKIP